MNNVNTKNFRVTKEQLIFLSLCGKQISERNMLILERALVNGENQSNIADDNNVSQQYVNKLTKGIYGRLAKQMKDIPESFIVRTVAIHPTLLAELEALQVKSFQIEEG